MKKAVFLTLSFCSVGTLHSPRRWSVAPKLACFWGPRKSSASDRGRKTPVILVVERPHLWPPVGKSPLGNGDYRCRRVYWFPVCVVGRFVGPSCAAAAMACGVSGLLQFGLPDGARGLHCIFILSLPLTRRVSGSVLSKLASMPAATRWVLIRTGYHATMGRLLPLQFGRHHRLVTTPSWVGMLHAIVDGRPFVNTSAEKIGVVDSNWHEFMVKFCMVDCAQSAAFSVFSHVRCFA